MLQSSGMDSYLTVAETVAMYAGFFPHPRPVDEVIQLVGLEAKRDTRVLKLSGGQQRRLDVAIALAGNPDLLFLDEPTTGFDPSARHEAWEVIKNLAELGKTVLLTTHYMDEAQYLADQVAVISSGRIVAEGTPATIGNRELARARIRYRLPDGAAPPADLTASPGPDGLTELVPEDLTAALHRLTGWALDQHVELTGLEVTRPTAGGRLSGADRQPGRAGRGGHQGTGRREPGRPQRMAQVMNAAALTLSQIRYVNKAFWRNPASAFFIFAFPLMFLVIFTALLGHGIGAHLVQPSGEYLHVLRGGDGVLRGDLGLLHQHRDQRVRSSAIPAS